jgi:hypothetical protein
MTPIAPHSVDLLVTGWIQENDLIYIKLGAGKYQLGETVFSIPYNGGEQIIDKDQIDNLTRIHEERRLSHYENVDTKEVSSVEGYMTKRQELDVKEWDENAEENRWPSITARHAFELFTALWQPIHENITTFQKVKIVLEGEVPKDDHPFIKPIRKISGDLTNTLYIYNKNAHVVSLLEFYFKKNGYRVLDQEPPSMSNPKDMDRTYWLKGGSLEYSRMFPSREAGSKYITIEIPGLKQYEKIVGRNTGTFEQLEGLFKVVDEEVRAILGSYFNKTSPLDVLDKTTIGEALNGLETLARLIRQVDSMKKTNSEYYQACEKADNLIKMFRKAASE